MTRAKVTLPPSRQAALNALERILPTAGASRALDLQAGLDDALRTLQDPRDRALATELVYGYCRLKGRMDFLAARHLSRPEGTPPGVVRIIGLAAYELTQLTDVPPHATLSWAVDAARNGHGEAPAKLVNAVMRRIQALGDAPNQPSFYRESAKTEEAGRSAWYACPEWIIALWEKDYGPEITRILLEAQLRKPLLGIRVNASRPGAPGLHARLVRDSFAKGGHFPFFGFELARTGLQTGEVMELERQGALSRQSLAVGDALERLGWLDWQGPIWDACCGRGGKSLALMEHGREVWCSDVSRHRLRALPREAWRLRLPVPAAFVADASHPPLGRAPQTIVIDAPCTGLGVLARRPDSKWKRTPRDVQILSALQRRIIQACAATLKPGGTLVYMTCTMTRQENDAHGALLKELGLEPVSRADASGTEAIRESMWGFAARKRG